MITHPADHRLLPTGKLIPSEGYCDQPYVVTTDDGAWLCVMTTGKGKEGDPGQHVVSMRSTDQGRTWSEIVPIEPVEGPEASYAVLLKVPYGRIYAFYNHNTDRVPELRCEDESVIKRVDSLGHYVFKYSDDHGRTWSAKRYEVPIREFACDRNNVYGGKVRFFWNVGRPLIVGDAAILVLHKVGAMGAGFFAQSEGAFLKSTNILTERDPAQITFETLPDGDIGLCTPVGGGRIAEEQSIVELSDGSLFCVYRTVDGWPACAYSRDGGHMWTKPAYMTYSPGGRRVKHPRAANFVWNCTNGKFLYWFHNHGGPFIRDEGGGRPYEDRNPAWLLAGREVDTPQGKCLEWSQPEILLYEDDPYIRISYPDLIEADGRLWITETQKSIARVHEIPAQLLDGLFSQFQPGGGEVTEGLLFRETPREAGEWSLPMPSLSFLVVRDFERDDNRGKDLRAGCTVELRIGGCPEPGTILFDSRDNGGSGILARMTAGGKIEVLLSDAKTVDYWTSDAGTLAPDEENHVAIIVDGGPKLILFVINGVLCDGGEERQFGWGRYNPNIQHLNGADEVRLAGCVTEAALYSRALRVSEAIQNSLRLAPISPATESILVS